MIDAQHARKPEWFDEIWRRAISRPGACLTADEYSIAANWACDGHAMVLDLVRDDRIQRLCDLAEAAPPDLPWWSEHRDIVGLYDLTDYHEELAEEAAGTSPVTIDEVAVHEAGHAVAFALAGLSTVRVSIIPRGERAGFTEMAAASLRGNGPVPKLRHSFATAAGAFANMIVGGKEGFLRGFHEMPRAVQEAGAAVAAFKVVEAEQAARRIMEADYVLLGKYRFHIERLAEELLRVRSLDCRSVAAFLPEQHPIFAGPDVPT